MKLYNILPVLIVGILLVSGCVQQGGQTPDTGTTPTGETKEFEIIAKQFEFVPNTITVNKGDMVELHIESIDVTHGFSLPDFGVNEVLAPGNDVHVEFLADKTGTFTFSCSVPCGSGHGRMSGQLIVK